MINLHFMYEKLGLTDTARQVNYRELFRYSLELGIIDKVHKATNGGFVLGNDQFKEEISKVLGRRVQPGRPVKNEK